MANKIWPTDYESFTPTDDMNLMIDNGSGMGKATVASLANRVLTGYTDAIIGGSNQSVQTAVNNIASSYPTGAAMTKNGLYRGNNLGTFSSIAQIETFLNEHSVAEGLFSGLYLGDCLTLSFQVTNPDTNTIYTESSDWMIAGFDIKTNIGDSVTSSHHIALIPKTSLLYDHSMNAAETEQTINVNGYAGSLMHTSWLASIITGLRELFDTHVLSQRCYITTSSDSTTYVSSAASFVSTYATLLTESQVYGYTVYSSSGLDVGEGYFKLPVFNFINPSEFGRKGFWLRSTAPYANSFCAYAVDGYPTYEVATTALGVRPMILIG